MTDSPVTQTDLASVLQSLQQQDDLRSLVLQLVTHQSTTPIADMDINSVSADLPTSPKYDWASEDVTCVFYSDSQLLFEMLCS